MYGSFYLGIDEIYGETSSITIHLRPMMGTMVGTMRSLDAVNNIRPRLFS